MTHRLPSDRNEAMRQWSHQTDLVERAMAHEAKYVDALSSWTEEGYSPMTRRFYRLRKLSTRFRAAAMNRGEWQEHSDTGRRQRVQ